MAASSASAVHCRSGAASHVFTRVYSPGVHGLRKAFVERSRSANFKTLRRQPQGHAPCSFAQAASSAAATPRVDQRQANQEKRIDQGIASGELNQRETRRLEKQQSVINRAEDRAKADGTVTKTERRSLHKMQNHASKRIHHQKHDAQTAKP
jgi:hypothetical protein